MDLNVENVKDWHVLTFLVGLVLALKFPVINLSYHWDAILLVQQSEFYALNSFFALPPGGGGVHVPFLQWLLAGLYSLFGESVILSHVVIYAFSITGLFFTYLTGKELYSKKVGFIASLFLLFSPIYFALSGQVLFDIPLVAMTMVTLYFGLKGKLKFYLPAALLLVLTKEPGFLAVFAIAVYRYLKTREIKDFVIYFSPLIGLILWELHLFNTGYSTGWFGLKFLGIITAKRFAASIYQILFWNYHWILSIFLIVYIYKEREELSFDLENPEKKFPLILTASFYLLLFGLGPVNLLPRYLLPITPIFSIFSVKAIIEIDANFKQILVIVIIFLFASCWYWNSGIKGAVQDPVFRGFMPNKLTSVNNGELSLEYTDYVKMEGKVWDYITKNCKDSEIVAAYPFEMKEVRVKVKNRKRWKSLNISIFRPGEDKLKEVNYLVHEPYYRPEYSIDKVNKTLLKEYSSGGDTLKIFELN